MKLPGFVTRNWKLKLLAGGLSSFIWVGVVYAGNPPETRSVTVQVPQDPATVPGDFLLAHPVPDLTLSISGTRDHLNSFSTSSLDITVEYRSITRPGEQAVGLVIHNRDRNVELDNPPRDVTVTADRKATADLAVAVDAKPPPAGYVVDTAATKVAPQQITVTGAEQKLKNLRAVIQPNLENWKTNFDAELPIVLLDGNGQRVGDVGVSPSTVAVSLRVTSQLTDRAVAVVPNYVSATVGSGHILTGVLVDPPTVTVRGSQDLLSGLTHVSTAPISFSGINGTRQFTVGLALPAGVTSDTQSVTVTVTVIPLPVAATPSPTAVPPTPHPAPSAPSPAALAPALRRSG